MGSKSKKDRSERNAEALKQQLYSGFSKPGQNYLAYTIQTQKVCLQTLSNSIYKMEKHFLGDDGYVVVCFYRDDSVRRLTEEDMKALKPFIWKAPF